MISGTILVILFISSTINSSILLIPIQTPKALAAEDKEDEETAYLKFVSQTVNKSNNSKSSTTTTSPDTRCSKRTSNTCKRLLGSGNT